MTTEAQTSKPARQVVCIPPDLAPEIRSAAKQVGCRSLQGFVAAGLMHITRKINAGELAMVNGELQPTAKAA